MKPLLACNAPADLSILPYPLLASTKLDGIRCLIKDGVAYSRTLKPIRNKYIQSILGRPEFNGLDGELIVGAPNDKNCMQETSSGVMSFDGEPDFNYFVFDYWNRAAVQYHEALSLLKEIPNHPHIQILPQYSCASAAAVESYEHRALDEGYEGLILRRPDGLYKHGRATLREGYLLKLKRFMQEEAIVIDYVAWERNDNEPELNALGYTQRSTAKAGKAILDLLGALVVEGMFEGNKVVFNIGSGFTLLDRALLWDEREKLIGKIVSYKFFPVGSKDRPRHPVFKGFRHADDL